MNAKLTLGTSAITGTVYAGKIKPNGYEWYAGKTNVTEAFYKCAVLKFTETAEFEVDGMKFRATCERIG